METFASGLGFMHGAAERKKRKRGLGEMINTCNLRL